MATRTYKIKLLHLDTEKYAKAIASKVLREKERSVKEGILIVESTNNLVLLKNKLGIRDDEYITEEQPVKKSESSENLDEESENGDSDKDEKKDVNAASESEEAEGSDGSFTANSEKNRSVAFMSEKSDDQISRNSKGRHYRRETERNFSNGSIKLEVPTLKAYDFDTIQDYIADLKRAKEYGRFKSDQDLIFSSLVKSDKTKLYNDMGPRDGKCIEKFEKFLLNVFGLDQDQLWQKFWTLNQSNTENCLQFYNKLVCLFYKIRGRDVPEKHDPIHEREMHQAFLKGLRNREVAKTLMRNKRRISFTELG